LVTKPDQDMGAGKGLDYYAVNSIRDIVDLASPLLMSMRALPAKNQRKRSMCIRKKLRKDILIS